MSSQRLCRRCHTPVTKSEVDGYSYYCPEHDEDLYDFETIDSQSGIPCQLIGENSNIFNLLGIARNSLKRGNRSDLIEPLTKAVTSSGSYEEALCRIGDFVEIE